MLKKAKNTVKMSKEFVLSDSLKESIFLKKSAKHLNTLWIAFVEILVFESVRKRISYKSVFQDC